MPLASSLLLVIIYWYLWLAVCCPVIVRVPTGVSVHIDPSISYGCSDLPDVCLRVLAFRTWVTRLLLSATNNPKNETYVCTYTYMIDH
jgi:hypothetical protein